MLLLKGEAFSVVWSVRVSLEDGPLAEETRLSAMDRLIFVGL
jgi:hypothetical protein